MSGTGLHVHPDMNPDDILAHYGVPGMQWGKRKATDESSDSSTKSGLSDGQKKALKYAAGGALVAGALVATAILAKNGKLPVSSLSSSSREAKVFAEKTKSLDAIAIKRNAEQAARQQIVRNQAAARQQYLATERISRQKFLNDVLSKELSRRGEANQAASAARGEALAKRLGMSTEDYWQKQVSDFRKQNYYDTEEYR